MVALVNLRRCFYATCGLNGRARRLAQEFRRQNGCSATAANEAIWLRLQGDFREQLGAAYPQVMAYYRTLHDLGKAGRPHLEEVKKEISRIRSAASQDPGTEAEQRLIQELTEEEQFGRLSGDAFRMGRPPAAPKNLVASVMWVLERELRPLSQVTADDMPSLACPALLKRARGKDASREFQPLVEQAMRMKIQQDEIERMNDDGRIISILDECLRMRDDAEVEAGG